MGRMKRQDSNTAVFAGGMKMSRYCACAAIIAISVAAPRAMAQCQWQPLGGGVASGFPTTVNALTVFNDELIAGGNFTTAGGVSASNIARWNGASWMPLGTGTSGTFPDVLCLYVHGNWLIAGGSFTSAGGISTNRIARWNGTIWRRLGPGFDSGVFALGAYDGDLIAGGQFGESGGGGGGGGSEFNHIARWNGQNWLQMNSGINLDVRAVTNESTEFIAGGESFDPAIHRWNGLYWQPMDNVIGPIYALAVYDNELIAAGGFTQIGGANANYIARWNGTSWQSLGSGMNGWVYSLLVCNGKLFAGGSFTLAGGANAKRIACWDGTNWAPLGTGMNSTVNALALFNGELIAGGSFTTAGDVTVNRIARWSLDTDCDGLPDDWEINGIPYIKSDGSTGYYLLPGANPFQKDIYIEIDAMVGRVPTPNALLRVKNAFNQAGISLHILGGSGNGSDITSVDEVDLTLADYFDPANPSVSPFAYFQYDKSIHFGFDTPAERGDTANWPAIKQAKAKAFRYCIFANSCSADGRTIGLSEATLCNDFMVTLGQIHSTSPSVQKLEDYQAATFMHELGHSLGLSHGGGDGDDDRWNYKPNYFSVMNYSWCAPTIYLPSGGTPERSFSGYFPRFSQGALPALNENQLSESEGIHGLTSLVSVPYSIPTGTTNCTSHLACAQLPTEQCQRVAPFVGPVDWNNDCNPQSPGVVQGNINAIGLSGATTQMDVLTDHDDWNNLLFSFVATPAFADTFVPSTVPAEITTDVIESLNTVPAPEHFLGDLNCDGFVDNSDVMPFILALIDPPQYRSENPDCYLAYGDLNHDGVVNGSDIGPFVTKLLEQ